MEGGRGSNIHCTFPFHYLNQRRTLNVPLPTCSPCWWCAQQFIWKGKKVGSPIYRERFFMYSVSPTLLYNAFCMQLICNETWLCISLMWSRKGQSHENKCQSEQCGETLSAEVVITPTERFVQNFPRGIMIGKLMLSLLIFSTICSQRSGINSLC